MIKIGDSIAKTLIRKDISVQTQLFRFMSFCGCLSMAFGAVYAILQGDGILSAAGMIGGAAFMGALLCSGEYFKNYDMCSFILTAGFNAVFLPWTFLRSGGLDGGISLWFVLGFVTQFILLRGWKLFAGCVIAVISDAVCIYIAFEHPELIMRNESQQMAYVGIIISTAITAALVCVFLYIQINLYEYQRRENEKQKTELIAAMNTQSRFLANMSHEIRTPINTIIGLNEMTLREENLSEEIIENSNNIQSAGKMLLALINDILDLSKIEAGRMEVVPARYETAALFSEMVNTTWVRAHEKNLEFAVNISPDLPSMLYGDEMRIKQILTNILSNAIKYTASGSVTLFVEGEQSGMDEVILKMSVTDTGMGIRQDDMKYLFDSFKRVNEGNTKGIEGTGLGLSICSQLVKLMGGNIAVDSIYQKGSTFTVTIPQKIVNADPLGTLDYNSSQGRNRQTYKKTFEAPAAKVLVVDDNGMNLLVVKKLLRETKVQLSLAHSGRECLKMTAKTAYDVIFMDHVMPDMDGQQTLENIRNQENGFCRHTPVVALTANAMSGAEEKYRKMGFSDYLAKPINGMLLEAMLLRYLPEERVNYVVDREELKNMEGFRVLGEKKKQRIIISTDNVSDLPKEVVSQLGIAVLHYYVNTKNGHYEDMVEIHTDSLMSYIQREEYVRSEPPSVEEYEAFFGNLLEEAEQILHISIADGSGKGYAYAKMAAKGFAHIQVFDSGHLSSGTGLMVMAAANMALKAAEPEEIISYLKGIQKKVQTGFILDKSDQLYRSGRLGKNVWELTKLLECHPVLSMKKHKIKLSAVCFGDTMTAYKKYIRDKMKHSGQIDPGILFITSAGCSRETKDMILKEVGKYQKFEKIYMQEASAAITSNCGIGCFGLIYILK